MFYLLEKKTSFNKSSILQPFVSLEASKIYSPELTSMKEFESINLTIIFKVENKNH